MPYLAFGVCAAAGLAPRYLPALPWWTAHLLGTATALLTISNWAGTAGVITGPDHKPIPTWHVATRIYLAGSYLIGGLWLTGVTATGRAYTPPALWSIGVATLLAGIAYPRIRGNQRRYEQDTNDFLEDLHRPASDVDVYVDADPEPDIDPLAEKWEDIFARAGLRDMEFISERPGASGPIIHMRLPEDMTVNYEMVKQQAERLNGIIGHGMPQSIRPGAVRVQRAKNEKGRPIATEVYVYVDVEDILAQIIWLPNDHSPMSIYKAFPIGKFADGTYIYLNLATIHAMIVGMTRSGKSNLLHVLIFQISRCFDAVIWMYDGKGGATATHWLTPWLNGVIDPTTGEPLAAPVLDWVAVDRFECERMILALVEIARTRPLIRRARGEQGDKWVATAKHPAIFAFLDEIAEALGAHTGPKWASGQDGATSGDLGQLMTSVLTLGAGEQVHVIASGQRGTVTMFGPGDGKSQIGGRIAFPMTAMGDGSDVFQKNPEATRVLAALEHAGSVVVEGFGLGEPLPGKVFLAGTETNLATRIAKWVILHTPLRPELDEDTERIADKYGYADRWEDEDRVWWTRGLTAPPPTLRRFTGATAAPGAVATLMRPSPDGSTLVPISPLDGQTVPPIGVSPFKGAFDRTAAALNNGGTLPPAGGPPPMDADGAEPLDDDQAAVWERIELDHANEVTAAAAAALASGNLHTSPVDDEKRKYNRFVEIVDQSGTNGIAMPAIWEILSREGLAPGVRGTLYTWRDKAESKGDITCPTRGRNALMYSRRHARI